MRVLFIYTNINGAHDDNYAFGLASILSSTRAAGHETDILIVKTREEYSKVTDSLESFQPQIVGFTAVSSQYCFVKELSKIIKLYQQFPPLCSSNYFLENVSGSQHADNL